MTYDLTAAVVFHVPGEAEPLELPSLAPPPPLGRCSLLVHRTFRHSSSAWFWLVEGQAHPIPSHAALAAIARHAEAALYVTSSA